MITARWIIFFVLRTTVKLLFYAWKENPYKQGVQKISLPFSKFITHYAIQKQTDRWKFIFNLKILYVLYSSSASDSLVALNTLSQ